MAAALVVAIPLLLAIGGCAGKPATTEAVQPVQEDSAASENVTTFTVEAGTPDVDGDEVYVTFEDGSSGSLPISGELQVGDTLEYEKRVSASGDVSVRFLRNLSADARQAKLKRSADFTLSHKDGDVIRAEQLRQTYDLTLFAGPVEKAFKDAVGKPLSWGTSMDLAGNVLKEVSWPWIRAYRVNGPEVMAAVERNRSRMAAGQPLEDLPDDVLVYAITFGAVSPNDDEAKLVLHNGVWYLEDPVRDNSRLINLAEVVLSDLAESHPDRVPPVFDALKVVEPISTSGSTNRAPTSAQQTDAQPYTPGKGSAERTAILDACRRYVEYDGLFKVLDLRVQGDRAVAEVTAADFVADDLTFYLSKEAGVWAVKYERNDAAGNSSLKKVLEDWL